MTLSKAELPYHLSTIKSETKPLDFSGVLCRIEIKAQILEYLDIKLVDDGKGEKIHRRELAKPFKNKLLQLAIESLTKANVSDPRSWLRTVLVKKEEGAKFSTVCGLIGDTELIELDRWLDSECKAKGIDIGSLSSR